MRTSRLRRAYSSRLIALHAATRNKPYCNRGLVPCLVLIALALNASTTRANPPNVVLFLADDLGYGDLGCYGSESIVTPNLDALAARGVRFTDYYAPSSVCSASRAALLTGCYPPRVGIKGVISANAKIGIADEERLLSELLKDAAYDTAIFGKWHLGNQPQFWPTRHGFDEWLGTIGSNDMGRGKPSLESRRLGQAGVELVNQNQVVETNPDQSQLTERYTQRAVAFIKRKRQNPFFVYVPYNMPHTPLFASKQFVGQSKRGLYGDVVEEIDASVGRVLTALDEVGATDNTLVIFASDNGPWLIFGDHGGSAGPLAGGKKQTLEGGHRVPCIAALPNRFTSGVKVTTPVSGVDWLPTIAELADVDLPQHSIDGTSIVQLCSGTIRPAAASVLAQHPVLFFYDNELRALRQGPWKLQFSHQDKQSPDASAIGNGGARGSVTTVARPFALFNITADPSESRDVSMSHRSVVEHLSRLAEIARHDLGDALTKTAGHTIRPAGQASTSTIQTNSRK